MTLFAVPVLSDAPECLGGGQAGGADGGQQSGEGADDEAAARFMLPRAVLGYSSRDVTAVLGLRVLRDDDRRPAGGQPG
jgi:hypothetical protein